MVSARTTAVLPVVTKLHGVELNGSKDTTAIKKTPVHGRTKPVCRTNRLACFGPSAGQNNNFSSSHFEH